MIHKPKDESPINKCPDPDCQKDFKARADNMRAHFETHLKLSSSRRNRFRTFGEFYGFIRNDPEISPETADRYIQKLEDWKRKGGHLKLEKSENIKSEDSGRSRGQ
jgi:hypothetical protein